MWHMHIRKEKVEKRWNMTTKLVNNEDHPTEIYPWNTRNTAVRVRGVRGVPISDTVPEPVLPVLETPRVLPYPCGTLLTNFGGILQYLGLLILTQLF